MPTPVYTAPGSGSGFIPSFEASGQLIAGYTRNVNDFALNRWVQIQPITSPLAFYLNIDPANAARVLGSDGEGNDWADGNDAPDGADNPLGAGWSEFMAKRSIFPFRVGHVAQKYSSYDITSVYASQVAQQAMTLRTIRAVAEVAAIASNGGATATATALGGGKFDSTGTTTTIAPPYFRTALNKAFISIQKSTYGKLKPKDMQVVMNPNTAALIGESDEIVQYCLKSNVAVQAMKGDMPVYDQYGIPDRFAGYNIVVEDAVKNTAKKGASSVTPAYCFPDQQVAMTARVGGLEIPYGAPSFSSITLFELEGMTVELKDDTDNRVVKGRVIDHYKVQTTSGISTYLITSATN
jgi:hypothetical protein